jgi:hypothetical protein
MPGIESISGMPAMVPVDTSIQSWTFGGFTFCAAALVVRVMHPIASKVATGLDGKSFMEPSLKPGAYQAGGV